MDTKIDIVLRIIEIYKSKADAHICSYEYAKAYCFGYLDAIIESDEDYDILSKQIDDVFN